MRALYSLAWLLALPFAFLYLLWRSRRQPEYRRHWLERLGWAPRPAGRPVIWIHAVSVGETRAAAPLVNALLERHPDCAILLTHTTPTGRATGRELFGGRVRQAYLPYDLSPLTSLFLRRIHPALGVIMETELWPNLMHACRRRGTPVVLANARLSERSARGYRRFGTLARKALANLEGIAAQSEADAGRLLALGAKRVEVTGNVKFDVTPPPNTQASAAELRGLFTGRYVFLCASTREGEEDLLLDCLAGLDLPGLLIVLVPRHPQRFEAVAEMLRERGLVFARRSEMERISAKAEALHQASPGALTLPSPGGRGENPVTRHTLHPNARVFLGDSMGELAAYYAAADLCYVGGSLLPLGGQNLIEAAAAGCPALIGPYTWNFQEASEQAVTEGAARRVADGAELREALLALHGDTEARRRMAEAGLAFARANRGATGRILRLIEDLLPPTPALHARKGVGSATSAGHPRP